MPRPTIAAILVAAGRGERARSGGRTRPKQFEAVAGRPLFAHSLETLRRHPAINRVVLVVPPEFEGEWLAAGPPVAIVRGGEVRQASVRAGLEALASDPPDLVLIHDAARPVLGAGLIERVIAALQTHDGAIPALPVSDTLKRKSPDGVLIAGTVPREGLFRVQTPQGFRYPQILAAHRAAAGEAFTDDAAVAEGFGLACVLVAGDERNIKVTHPDDFALAEMLLGARAAPSPGRTATGHGFDVHRLVPGDGVWLCGIKIASDMKLLGHSDADAGLHALTDAVLGALGAGDIGDHFPPTDESWRGAASDQFLAHACALARARQALIQHLDVTIIAERPKIKPYREAMRERIAQIAGLMLEQVSVKATTSEGLGFTGRGEGLAAEAIATLLFQETAR